MPASTSVFLNVADIDRSLKFYKALGFRVTETYKEGGRTTYAELDMDGAELGLGSISSNDDADFQKWVSTPLGAGVLVTIALPRGVDAVFAKAKKAGAVIETGPMDRPYGRVFMMDDPDGYVVSFSQPLAKKPRAKKAAPKPKKTAVRKAKASSKKRVTR